MAWRVDLDKGDFIGREALVVQQAAGVPRRLCTFTLESMAYPVSGEAIIADGEVVGFTTSANFGHTVGKPIAYGYVPAELADRRDFVIEVYGEPIDLSDFGPDRAGDKLALAEVSQRFKRAFLALQAKALSIQE